MDAQQSYHQHEPDKAIRRADTDEKVCATPLATIPSGRTSDTPTARTSDTPTAAEVLVVRGGKAPGALPKLPVTLSSPTSTFSASPSPPTPKCGWTSPRPLYRLTSSPIAEEVERGQLTHGLCAKPKQGPNSKAREDARGQRKPPLPEKPRFFSSPLFANPSGESPARSRNATNTNQSYSQRNVTTAEDAVSQSSSSSSHPRTSSSVFTPPSHSIPTGAENGQKADCRDPFPRPGRQTDLLRRGSSDISFSLGASSSRPPLERSRTGTAKRTISIKSGVPLELEEAELEEISIIQRIYLRAAADLNSNDSKKVEHARLMLHRLKQVGFDARPKSLSHPLPATASSPTITVTVTDLSPPTATSTPYLDNCFIWTGEEADRKADKRPEPRSRLAKTNTDKSNIKTDLANYAESLFAAVNEDKERAQLHKR